MSNSFLNRAYRFCVSPTGGCRRAIRFKASSNLFCRFPTGDNGNGRFRTRVLNNIVHIRGAACPPHPARPYDRGCAYSPMSCYSERECKSAFFQSHRSGYRKSDTRRSQLELPLRRGAEHRTSNARPYDRGCAYSPMSCYSERECKSAFFQPHRSGYRKSDTRRSQLELPLRRGAGREPAKKII